MAGPAVDGQLVVEAEQLQGAWPLAFETAAGVAEGEVEHLEVAVEGAEPVQVESGHQHSLFIQGHEHTPETGVLVDEASRS